MTFTPIRLFPDVDQNRIASFSLRPSFRGRNLRDVLFRSRDKFLKTIRLFHVQASVNRSARSIIANANFSRATQLNCLPLLSSPEQTAVAK
jgi:hypothetical protein